MIDQHKTLGEKFLKKGFRLYLFSFIIAPIGYIIKIIISWELSVSEVGILYWIISLITLVWALNDFWMTESLNHFIPKYITEKKYDKVKSILVYTLIIQMITWLLIALFFFFWADFIANNYFKTNVATNILKIFAFYFFGINIFQIIWTFFMSIQNTFYLKILDLTRMSFTLICVLLVYFMDLSSIIMFSLSWIIWLYIWITVSIIIFIKKYYNKYLINEKIIWSKKLFIPIFKYAIFVFIWAQASSILWQMDMQMIIYILWTVDAWYYTNYLSIIWIPFIIITPIFWLLFPIFSEMHAKGEIKKIKLVKSIFTKNFLAIWIAFNILFFVFAEKIAFILFWEKFIESWIILKYSILLLIFNFLLQINFNIMAWIWKVKERVKIISIVMVFNFIMNLILIKYIWVYWVALATWSWWVLIWWLSEFYLGKKYVVWFFYKTIFKNFFFMWILWYLFFLCMPFIFDWLSRLNSLLYLFILIIIWFIIFIIINYKEFKMFILEIKNLKKW